MTSTPASGPLSLLVLGGTAWLGRAVAARAVERGHHVTCLARGESGTPAAGSELGAADRWQPGAYDEVAGRDWDAVVDVSWQPDLVRGALAALAGRASRWLYVSSCSVYADDVTPNTDEAAPLLEAWQGTGPVGIDRYGPAKVACEQAVLEAVGPERALLARAGLIAGHGDPSDRFGYWPARVARMQSPDEVVLAPPVGGSVQVIDVLDLAAWLVTCAERRTAGAFNAVGEVTDIEAVLRASVAATGNEPVAAEAEDDWLLERGVAPWSGPDSLPLWLPAEYAGDMTRSNAAAVGAGLVLRPLAETTVAALAWERELGLDRERRSGLSAARELELLTELLGVESDA
ncbi:MAG: oxidoreductase [Nocardioidaceae bacterium]